MADVVEVLYDENTSVIVNVAPSEIIALGVGQVNVVEATAVIGPTGPQGFQGLPATAWVDELPPVPSTPGDLWIEPVTGADQYGDYPADVFVSPVNPEMTNPGIWIQTGMGRNGQGFTFWIETGV